MALDVSLLPLRTEVLAHHFQKHTRQARAARPGVRPHRTVPDPANDAHVLRLLIPPGTWCSVFQSERRIANAGPSDSIPRTEQASATCSGSPVVVLGKIERSIGPARALRRVSQPRRPSNELICIPAWHSQSAPSFTLALPFCHLALRAQKPPLATYPRDLKTVGDHVRKRRLDLGLLQRDAAERLGVHKMTVNNWENNRRSPQLRFVPRIIEFLGYIPYDAQPEALGKRIVLWRRTLGLTQRELACRLGVAPSTLGRWERDKGKPSRGLFERLDAFLASLAADVGEREF